MASIKSHFTICHINTSLSTSLHCQIPPRRPRLIVTAGSFEGQAADPSAGHVHQAAPLTRPTKSPQRPHHKVVSNASIEANALAKALTKEIIATESVEELLDIIDVKQEQFSYIHAGVAFHRLAKLAKKLPNQKQLAIKAHPAIAFCSSKLLEHSSQWNEVTVSNLLSAHATLHHGTRPLLAEVLLQLRKERDFEPQHIISLVYGMAKLNCRNPVFFRRLSKLIQAPSASPSGLAFSSSSRDKAGISAVTSKHQLAASLQKTEHPMGDLLEVIPRDFHTCDTKDLTLLVWSLCQLYRPDSQLPPPVAIDAAFQLATLSIQADVEKINSRLAKQSSRKSSPEPSSKGNAPAASVRSGSQRRLHPPSVAVPFQSLYMLTSSAASCPAVSLSTLDQVLSIVCTAVVATKEAAHRMNVRDCSTLVHALAKLATKLIQAQPGSATGLGTTNTNDDDPTKDLCGSSADISNRSMPSISNSSSAVAPHNPTWAKRIHSVFDSRLNGVACVNTFAVAIEHAAPQMNEQQLTMCAWACAMLQLKRPTLSSALESRAVQLAGDRSMSLQGASQMCWAFAVLHVDTEKLVEAMAEAAADILESSTISGSTSLTSSPSHTGNKNVEPAVPHDINNKTKEEDSTGAAGGMSGGVSSQGLAMLAYSLALVDRCTGPQASRLFSLIAAQAEEMMDTFSPQGLCNLAWGFAVAGHYPPQFFQRWRRAVAITSNFNTLPRTSENNSSSSNPGLMQPQETRISPGSPSSISVSGSPPLSSPLQLSTDEGEALEPVLETASRRPELMFTPQELAQLHQVEVALRLEAPHIGIETPQDYANFFDALYKVGRSRASAKAGWGSQQTSTHRSITSYQTQIYNGARELGLPCELEYYDDAMEYSIDVALPSHKVAIEADGPTHFAVNTNRPLGATALKRRILKKLGWKVVAVPYFDWMRHTEVGTHKEYLRKSLERVGVFDPVTVPLTKQGPIEAAAERRNSAAVSTATTTTSNSEDMIGNGDVAADSSLAESGNRNEAGSKPAQQQQQQLVSVGEADEKEKEVEEIRGRAQQLDLAKYRQGGLSKAGLLARAVGRKAAAVSAEQGKKAEEEGTTGSGDGTSTNTP